MNNQQITWFEKIVFNIKQGKLSEDFIANIDHPLGLAQTNQCIFSNVLGGMEDICVCFTLKKPQTFNDFEELNFSNLTGATYLYEEC